MSYKGLDRSKVKKMYVWDGDVRPDNPKERYVLFINPDGSCIVVHEDNESNFKNGLFFRTISYRHCEEIIEKKYRDMTRDEVIEMILKIKIDTVEIGIAIDKDSSTFKIISLSDEKEGLYDILTDSEWFEWKKDLIRKLAYHQLHTDLIPNSEG